MGHSPSRWSACKHRISDCFPCTEKKKTRRAAEMEVASHSLWAERFIVSALTQLSPHGKNLSHLFTFYIYLKLQCPYFPCIFPYFTSDRHSFSTNNKINKKCFFFKCTLLINGRLFFPHLHKDGCAWVYKCYFDFS